MQELALRLLAFLAALLIEVAFVVACAQAAIWLRYGEWWDADLGDLLSVVNMRPSAGDAGWTARLLDVHPSLVLLMLASLVLLVALWLDAAFERQRP